MTESPPDGPEDQLPPQGGPPRLLMFDDEPEQDDQLDSRWIERRSSILFLLALVVVGGLTVWGLRSWMGGGSDTRIAPETFSGQVTVPAGVSSLRSDSGRASSDIEGTVSTTVELEVDANDAVGTALPDTLLTFLVESGTATLVVDTARTDSSGIARVGLTLPPRPETIVVAARVVGSDLPPVRRTVAARAGPAQSLVKVAGDRQRTDAAGLLEGLVVRVTDGLGNPVEGAQVFFQPNSDNGLVAPSRARTDSLGLASTRWRLGPGAGLQRLEAALPDVSVSPVIFTATALGSPAVAAADEPSGGDTARALNAEGAAALGTDTIPGADTTAEVEPVPVEVVRRTFAVGGTFVCSIASGRAACRGANDRGQLGGGGGSGFRGLAVGVSHACALDGSGVAWCWGANDGGQLGDGSRADRTTPVRVETESRFSILTAGAGHTCGLEADGSVACWGRNLSGQLGDGTRNDRSMPTPLPDEWSFRTLVAGWEHTCGLSDAGELACWGGNGDGQLGDASRTSRLAPTPVPGSFSSVVAGSRHTCGISGQRVLCWGDNSFGQLGDGSTQTRTRPVEVTDLPAPPQRLAAGAVHTCALLEDGAAWCWGQNVHGQLGDATNENRVAPSRVAGDLTFTSIFAGGALTCGFATDGSQYCWGLNQTGQLGDGTRVNRAEPTRVGG